MNKKFTINPVCTLANLENSLFKNHPYKSYLTILTPEREATDVKYTIKTRYLCPHVLGS